MINEKSEVCCQCGAASLAEGWHYNAQQCDNHKGANSQLVADLRIIARWKTPGGRTPPRHVKDWYKRINLAADYIESCAQTPSLYARDIDGTGSLHTCAKSDPGAIPFYTTPRAWQSMDTAPRTAEEILVQYHDRHGNKHVLVVHFAHGGGDDQPAFGPFWFYRTGFGFSELHGKPLGWMPIPKPD